MHYCYEFYLAGVTGGNRGHRLGLVCLSAWNRIYTNCLYHTNPANLVQSLIFHLSFSIAGLYVISFYKRSRSVTILDSFLEKSGPMADAAG